MTPSKPLHPDGSPSSYSVIEALLREKIISGVWVPGQRIPTSRVLATQFDTSQPTVHRALAGLVKWGFVQTQGRSGTFVVHDPPNLSRYGLVFEHNPYDPDRPHFWSHFFDAMISASSQLSQESHRQFVVFHDLHVRPSGDTSMNLLNHLHNNALRGVVYVHNEWVVEPLLTDEMRRIPRVAIRPGAGLLEQKLPRVWPDLDAFYRLSLDLLKERGRRRVGIISLGHAPVEMIDQHVKEVKKRGMVLEPFNVQAAYSGESGQARQAVEIMMRLPVDLRADGLIISDDNLIQSATQGLVRSAVRVGEDLDVVAHTNFPNEVLSPLPLLRVGFDAAELLHACIDLCEQHHKQGSEAMCVQRAVTTQLVQPVTRATYVDRVHA